VPWGRWSLGEGNVDQCIGKSVSDLRIPWRKSLGGSHRLLAPDSIPMQRWKLTARTLCDTRSLQKDFVKWLVVHVNSKLTSL